MILGYTVENTDIFCWMRIVNFYPFFYLGYVISIEDITKWLENKKIKVMAIISLITYFVICCVGIDKIFWLRFLLTGRSGYYRLEYGMAYGPLIEIRSVCYFILYSIYVPKHYAEKKIYFIKDRSEKLKCICIPLYFYLYLYGKQFVQIFALQVS